MKENPNINAEPELLEDVPVTPANTPVSKPSMPNQVANQQLVMQKIKPAVNQQPVIQNVAPTSKPVPPLQPNINTQQNVKPAQPNPNIVTNNSVTDKDAIVVTPPLKEVEITNNKDKSNSKRIFTMLLFFILAGCIIFMPEISEFMAQVQYNKEQARAPKIMSGTLICDGERSSDTLDMNYTYKFEFTDNKLNKLNFLSETRGDINEDKEKLDKLKADCDKAKKTVGVLEGIDMTCKFNTDTVVKNEIFTYSNIDYEKTINLFQSSGNVYPDYNYRQDVDSIEKKMTSSGYSCRRIK